MRCPTLKELPPPLEGKTGWPWTEETSVLPEQMSGKLDWPKISIVTPSYNQGQFIEETIRSVLLQGYPNLEYIIIDGGSNDNSVAIIKKYEKWLTYWVSEKDKGQANAINKGMEKATGAIAAYLNSDDMYLINSLQYIGKLFTEKKFDILVGKNKSNVMAKYYLLRKSWWNKTLQPFNYPFIFEYNCRYELNQESIFWNHLRFKKLRFKEKYHCCLDVWWFTQIYSGAYIIHSSRKLGFCRIHINSKSSKFPHIFAVEIRDIERELNQKSIEISQENKEKIIQSYNKESLKAKFFKLIFPFKDYIFEYVHPPYLKK